MKPLRIVCAREVDDLPPGDGGGADDDQAAGGQVGDRGELTKGGTCLTLFAVTDTQKVQPDVFGHLGEVKTGEARFARDAGNLLEVLQSVPLGLPHGGAMSSAFGERANPFTGRGSESHGGLDFKGATGEPVQATASGKVVFAGWQGGYGNVVQVAHAHGYTTLYAHLSRIDVERGQPVTAGDTVGLLGSTGRSTGPHLHYEVQRRGERLDPEQFLALNDAAASNP